jgi:hypothetical protein
LGTSAAFEFFFLEPEETGDLGKAATSPPSQESLRELGRSNLLGMLKTVTSNLELGLRVKQLIRIANPGSDVISSVKLT